MSTRLTVVFVGTADEELASCAQGLGAEIDVRQFATSQAAAATLAKREFEPELILLAESRPGQLSEPAIHALRKLAPLARVWRVSGSWCEGHKRSGHPLSGTMQSYWHQWRAEARRAIACALSEDAPPWALPATSTADEHTLKLSEQPLAQGVGTVIICAALAETAAALADACRAGGYRARVVSPGKSWSGADAAAVLWDVDAEGLTAEAIGQLRAQAGDAPILALVSFPRADDVVRASAAGIGGVISKPYALRDLLWHLERVTEGRETDAPGRRQPAR